MAMSEGAILTNHPVVQIANLNATTTVNKIVTKYKDKHSGQNKTVPTLLQDGAACTLINSKKIFFDKSINIVAAETIGFHHIVCYLISTTDFIVLSGTRVYPRTGTRFSL